MKNDHRYAFFDVDGTLLDLKSMFSFRKYLLHYRYPLLGAIKNFVATVIFRLYELSGRDRGFINLKYYETFRGSKEIDIGNIAKKWFAHIKDTNAALFVEPAIEILQKHRDSGVEPVFVSGSFCDLLQPLAQDLGVKHVLATRLETIDGVYTGRVLPPQMIGKGKAVAIEDFLLNQGVDGKNCFAYGDHYSDIPMLSMVGNPGVVRGDSLLKEYALAHGWRVIPDGQPLCVEEPGDTDVSLRRRHTVQE